MKQKYQAYMLRVWEERTEQPGSDVPLRLSLENTRTGTRIGFANLEHLLQYLREQTGANTVGLPIT